MRTRTWGQLDGTAATEEMPAKSRMRSAPGSEMLGNFLSVARTLAMDNPLSDERRSPPNSFWTLSAISFKRMALSSGIIPPGFKARASLEGLAESRRSGSTPISRFKDSQPLAQEASLAGYPQCHHTRKR